MLKWKPTDQGSRYKHYGELLDFWEEGIITIDNMVNRSKTDLEVREKLVTAVAVLRKQIDTLTRYQKGKYSDALFPIMQQVNDIPKDPTKIK